MWTLCNKAAWAHSGTDKEGPEQIMRRPLFLADERLYRTGR